MSLSSKGVRYLLLAETEYWINGVWLKWWNRCQCALWKVGLAVYSSYYFMIALISSLSSYCRTVKYSSLDITPSHFLILLSPFSQLLHLILQRAEQVAGEEFSSRIASVLNFTVLISQWPNVILFLCLFPFLLHAFPTTVSLLYHVLFVECHLSA